MDGDEILDDQGIQTWGALCMPQSPALLENEEASQPGSRRIAEHGSHGRPIETLGKRLRPALRRLARLDCNDPPVSD